MTTKTETWSGRREFPIRGRYFELLACENPVDVEAVTLDGQVLTTEQQVSSGFWIDRRDVEWFDRIAITTSGSEEVTFLVTDGTAGNRSVPADITNRAGRLLGIVYGTLGQLAQRLVGGVNALVCQMLGYEYGATFVSYAMQTANTSQTVFSAAANTAGAWVWKARARSGNNTTTANAVLTAHTSAPNNVTSGDIIEQQCRVDLWTGPTYHVYLELQQPVFIPAGKGLYYTCDVTETSGQRFVHYTLL